MLAIDLKEQYPCCCTLHPRIPFNTESGSVNEACKKKRTCVALNWIATNIHLNIVV